MAAEQPKTNDLGAKPIFSADGRTLTYGLYPQRRVGDSELIAALDAIPSPEANGYFLHRGVCHAKTIAKPDGSNRAFDDGTKIVEGTVYWFECEPIQWRILSARDGVCLALSERVLDARAFDGRENDYAASAIRAWLNGEFAQRAFGLDDTAIMLTEVDNGATTTDSPDNHCVCGNTKDRVFLPSYRDYLEPPFGFGESAEESPSRYAKTTDWARARGAWHNAFRGGCEHNGIYWTRSPYGGDSCYAWAIHDDGCLGYRFVCEADHGVRPAIMVKIESKQCVSLAKAMD